MAIITFMSVVSVFTFVECLLDQNLPATDRPTPDSKTDTHFMQELLLQEQQLRIELQKQITSLQASQRHVQSQIQDFQTRLRACESNYGILTNRMSELSSNISTKGQQTSIAFFVRLRNKIMNHHQSTILKFDDVLLNQENGYDSHVGIFTAPLDGIYKFDLVISSDKENGHGEIMHNGNRVLDVYADIHTHWFGRGSGAVILHLMKGDKVWIQNTDTGNTIINAGVESAFSGHLLFTA